MIRIGIPNLSYKKCCFTRSIEHIAFQEIIRTPFDSGQQFIRLSSRRIALGKLQASPGQIRETGGQGEPEFAVITCVVIAPSEIEL